MTRRIRLLADSALHVANTELTVVDTDAVAAHGMESVSRAHAEHLVANALAEWVDPPVDEASLPVVMPVTDESTDADEAAPVQPYKAPQK